MTDEEKRAELAEIGAKIEDIEERLLVARERLAILLQVMADGKGHGGAVVGRQAPYSDEDARRFQAVVAAHDRATGSLWEALREAGYEVVEVPEAIYGILSPETR